MQHSFLNHKDTSVANTECLNTDLECVGTLVDMMLIDN